MLLPSAPDLVNQYMAAGPGLKLSDIFGAMQGMGVDFAKQPHPLQPQVQFHRLNLNPAGLNIPAPRGQTIAPQLPQNANSPILSRLQRLDEFLSRVMG